MKLKASLAVVTLSVLLLAGCTSPADSGSATETAPASQASTPLPTPTPEAMSVEDAANYYLDTVCPANVASETWNTATASGEFAAYKTSAQPLVDAYSAAAARFDDPAVLWPAQIEAADITALSNSYYADISVLQGIANANSEAEANFTFANRDAAAAASQKVRARLGLPSDTSSSCANR